MGKRNEKKSKSDIHTVKMKLASRKKYNPFEVHVNKQKHNVLGRKKKQDRGLPGIARNKAMKKREKTILQEYLLKSKTNKFVDRRIGENVPTLSIEDKMMARFSREVNRRTKSNIFNLNEDEELTHLGRSIGEIEKFDDPHSESEEEGNLDRNFVQKVHFGGFKENPSGEIEKSHKEKMDEIISESKKRKHERKVENEANVDMTEKLDEYWKTIGYLLNKNKKATEKDGEKNKNVEDYDVKVRELKFEAKGQASDRLKSVEEIAVEESEKLRQLEEERIKRMKGVTDQNKMKQLQHISADDLYDGFVLDDDVQVDENDGNEFDIEKKDTSTGDQDDPDGSDSDDSYSDVLSNEGLSSEDERNEEESVLICKKKVEDHKPDLPFVFAVPNSLEEFVEIITNCTPIEQKIIVDRIIKCNHPSLGANNRQKLETFFIIFLQYMHDLCIDSSSDLEILICLDPFFLTLLKLSPKVMSESVLDILKEMQECFHKRYKGRSGKGYPDLGVLHTFKIISSLYPTSDYRHPVVTPAMIFMSQLLITCRMNTHVDVASCIFLCETFLEYISLSKRFVPEILYGVRQLLSIAAKHDEPLHKKSSVNISSINILPSSPAVKETESSLQEKSNIFEVIHSKEKEFSDSKKIVLVSHTIAVISKITVLYEALPSFSEIFRPIADLCNKLPSNLYPEALQNELHAVIQQLQKPRVLSSLAFERKKPKPLRQYEPRFNDVFTGRKERVGSQKKLEHQKLVHKFKREMKGAVREIRQDNRFLANRQLRDQSERDMERKRKVKQLYAELSQQEGDFKKLKKKSISLV